VTQALKRIDLRPPKERSPFTEFNVSAINSR
jgi:hypothetical protein